MTSGILLKNGIIVNAHNWFRADVRVRGNRIKEIGTELRSRSRETVIDCSAYYIYPALINSHDHLEFNIYSRLGTPPYPNIYEFGNDLHRRWKTKIEKIQSIPLRYRLWWGAWKNLFSGVTTVVHHNPYYKRFRAGFPVHVARRYTFAHSLQFEPDIQRTLKKRRKGIPFLIHLAEGNDEISYREVKKLQSLGGIDHRTVAVHAIALSNDDVEILQNGGASVIWCPSSNLHLYNKTAPVDRLIDKIPVALGTDSTLTGSVTLFDELRSAREVSGFSSQQLFRLVTDIPRKIFGMNSDVGSILVAGAANLFMIRSNGQEPYDTLLDAAPADIDLLMRNGRIKFYESQLINRSNGFDGYIVAMKEKRKVITDPTFQDRYDAVKPYLTHYSYLDWKPKRISYSSGFGATHFFCPSCRTPLQKTKDGWRCENESYTFTISDAIPDFILSSRREEIERFLELYQKVRSAEQWGDHDPEFYSTLPYRDTSGTHSDVWKIRAATYDTFIEHLPVDSGSAPRILDAGAGNCWLSLKLAQRGYHVAAVDINIDSLDGLGVAQRLHKINDGLFQPVRAEFDYLPYPDNFFDHIVFNSSLHYSGNPIRTMKRTLRHLRENGTMWILDSPIYKDEESGRMMIEERVIKFKDKYDITVPADLRGNFLTFSDIANNDNLYSVEYLKPEYNLAWRLKPLVSYIMRRREPASFYILKIRKDTKILR